jgi:DNA-binding NarL/FixJ family response regulator
LRWAATVFAEAQETREVQACAAALTAIAADTGQAEALSALAHALGEIALLEGEPEAAAEQFDRALELVADTGAPFERAESQRRAAAALVAAGRGEEAVERLVAAHRTARRLGARPLAARLAADLAALGERAERHLGRRAAGDLERGGLSRRELEVVRLVAVGRTNREIARDLFLSPRTVDMHLRNILAKLGCRSRADASRKAAEMGLLEPTPS